MDKKIFREYDIRGVVSEDLTPGVVENLGKAFAKKLIDKTSGNKVVVGRDCRLSSNDLAQSLFKGLTSSGVDVIDIGICPTPVLYFSQKNFDTNGAIMITGSHNPPEFNGFKMIVGESTLHGKTIQELYEIIINNDFHVGEGTVEKKQIIPIYQSYIKENIGIKGHGMKVVIDSGNGTGGVVAHPIMDDLGFDVVSIFEEMDGNFPNHHPDPTVPDNLKALITKVKQSRAKVGIGYDGDADRIGVVDSDGNVIYGDKLFIIFARDVLTRIPNATFISEVKCSQTMYDAIAKAGGKPIMWKTGHSLIKQKMKDEKAALAGEMSGHMFFSEGYLGFDDAIYASCRLLKILVQTGKTVQELLEDIPKTFVTPEIRVACPDEEKFEVVTKVKEYFKKEYKLIDIDGARILFDEGWGLVRASNTQPVLVMRFEAFSEEGLNAIKTKVEEVVNGFIG
ncbi:MAG: phosphomannomutase/phosphoglucomutase [Pseudomonadota bacterium]